MLLLSKARSLYSRSIISSKGLGCVALSLGLWLVSTSQSYALGLSTFRIYLDPTTREYNFVVYNKDPYQQNCKMYLRHYDFNEYGKSNLRTSKELPELSAKDKIRFSPKRFSVPAGESQTVRFQMRRSPNEKAIEYRSYLTLDCAFSKADMAKIAKNKTSLAPRLRHNIPVIARTGDIEAKLSFAEKTINQNSINVTVEKNGARSTFGRLALIDIRNNEVVSSLPQVSIQREAKYHKATLGFTDQDPKFLKIVYQEIEGYGGNITIESPVL
ncbi:hypothetical protein [Thalassotalea ganghwensis]